MIHLMFIAQNLNMSTRKLFDARDGNDLPLINLCLTILTRINTQDAPELAALFGGIAASTQPGKPGIGAPGGGDGFQPPATPPLGPTSLAALGGASRDAKAKNLFREEERTEEDDLVRPLTYLVHCLIMDGLLQYKMC